MDDTRCNECATTLGEGDNNGNGWEWESATGVVVPRLCSECHALICEIGVY